MRISGGRREHQPDDPKCLACDSPDGKHWPQLHSDGLVIRNCAGLVHCEEVPNDDSRGSFSVIYRCDACGESI